MPEPEQVSVGNLLGTRFAHLLTYPSTNQDEAEARIKELSTTHVMTIQLRGPSLIDGIPLLGKGCVGVVVQALLDGVPVALKIRRTDANRRDMAEEARMLRVANSVDVGPKLITATDNFLVMELFEGKPLFKWAENKIDKSKVKEVVRKLLQASFRLDAIGLDHGELSHAPKNILISPREEPCIVDFETASTSRRVANVTSLLQYFLFGELSRMIQARRLFGSRTAILKTLAAYKIENSVSNFQRILEELGLE